VKRLIPTLFFAIAIPVAFVSTGCSPGTMDKKDKEDAKDKFGMEEGTLEVDRQGRRLS